MILVVWTYHDDDDDDEEGPGIKQGDYYTFW